MTKPRVLIVDDDPEIVVERLVAELEAAGVSADEVLPGKLTQAHIEAADLLLFDYRLDKWLPDRDHDFADRAPDQQQIADRPADGVALAAIARSRVRGERIRGIALLSANLEDLVQDFARSVTEHAAARVNALDWAFHKRAPEDLPPLAVRVAELARAVQAFREGWPDRAEESDHEEVIAALLRVPDEQWRESAVRDIHAAQPPLNQLAESTQGLAVLRWLAQRILPYPAFLLARKRLAMFCGVDPEPLSEDDWTALSAVFAAARYDGPLAGFVGERFWRAGIERRVSEIADDPRPGPALAAAVSKVAGQTLSPLDPPGSVLAIDEHLQVVGPVARELAVRVRPDDWPVFAETAWMRREDIDDGPHLRDLVDPADRALLRS